MNSRLEQIIAELEEYIEGCKAQPLAKGKIVADKDELLELVADLRQSTPEEIRRYQKIIANRDAILNDAQAKANELLSQAQIQTNELVSEHMIMQQAYAQANEVVTIATNQAQEILDQATADANAIRSAAVEYTDTLLGNLETICAHAMDTSKARYDSLIASFQECYDVIIANRGELAPTEEAPVVGAAAPYGQELNLI